MITLSLKDSGALIGTIDEADLEVLVGQLEEESGEDTDYYMTTATIELLEEKGASTRLVDFLREAVGDTEGVDVVWTES